MQIQNKKVCRVQFVHASGVYVCKKSLFYECYPIVYCLQMEKKTAEMSTKRKKGCKMSKKEKKVTAKMSKKKKKVIAKMSAKEKKRTAKT